MNLFKNTVGLLLLIPTLMLAGGIPWRETALVDIAIMVASGAVGIALADTLFFRGLNIIGAARMGVVETAYPVSVVLMSFVFLGERFTPLQWLGAVLVVGAVALAAVPEPGTAGEETDGERSRGLRAGFLAALAGVVLMGVGVVMAKPALDRMPVVWSSTLRLAGGQAALLLYAVVHPRRRELFTCFRPSSTWKITIPAAATGTYLAYMMWLGGMKYANVSTAALLNQMHVVYITLLAWIWLREKLTRAKLAAAAIAVVGSVIVALGGGGGVGG